jgi:hypothetical protein
MRTTRKRRGEVTVPVWLDVLFGAAAGAVGTWLMSPTMRGLTRVQSERDKQREKESSYEENATVKAAKRILRPVRMELDPDQKTRAGTALHWAYGVAWGIGYALLARRLGHASAARGTALGVALWAIGDEIIVPALGFAPRPQRFPVSTHAKAFGAHVAYGLGVDTAFRTLRRAARPVMGGDWAVLASFR